MPELDTTMQVIVKILAGSHGVIVLPTIAIWCHLASSSIWLKGQCVKCQAASWRCATPPLSRPAPVAIGDIWAMSAHIALFSVSSRNCFLFFGLHMRGKKNVARMGEWGSPLSVLLKMPIRVLCTYTYILFPLENHSKWHECAEKYASLP